MDSSPLDIKSLVVINLDDGLDNMVETIKNNNEASLIFFEALSIATTNTHHDPSLEHSSCLELYIAMSIVLVYPLAYCLPYLYDDEKYCGADDFLD